MCILIISKTNCISIFLAREKCKVFCRQQPTSLLYKMDLTYFTSWLKYYSGNSCNSGNLLLLLGCFTSILIDNFG